MSWSHALFLLTCLVAASSAGPAPSARVRATFEKAIRERCEAIAWEPEEGKPGFCSCLADREGDAKSVSTLCDSGGVVDQFLGNVLAHYRAARPPGIGLKRCWDILVREFAGSFLSQLGDACRQGEPLSRILAAFDSFSADERKRCWRISGLTLRGCLIAEPCGLSPTASVEGLPVSVDDKKRVFGNAFALVPRGTQIELCHSDLVAVELLKDPKRLNTAFNSPAINTLCNSPTLVKSTSGPIYGPANCHGIAQAFAAGNFLKRVPVTAITYHALGPPEACRTKVERIYADAVLAARLHRGKRGHSTHPRLGDFAIPVRGFLINMRHERDCRESHCGNVSLGVDCDAPDLGAHIFIEGMCESCWANGLHQQGFLEITDSGNWHELTSGCLLTVDDHSITVLLQSNGMCHYYEATTPWGPTLLHTRPCAELWWRFTRKWCPARPMEFHIEKLRPASAGHA